MTRTELREIMMQTIFELELSDEMTIDSVQNKCDEKFKGKKDKARALDILSGIVNNLESIDETINAHSKSWKTNRMAKVDLAILRLAIGESRYTEDMSSAIIVTEAINLSKKYSTEQSLSFVHGVLGAILKDEQ